MGVTRKDVNEYVRDISDVSDVSDVSDGENGLLLEVFGGLAVVKMPGTGDYRFLCSGNLEVVHLNETPGPPSFVSNDACSRYLDGEFDGNIESAPDPSADLKINSAAVFADDISPEMDNGLLREESIVVFGSTIERCLEVYANYVAENGIEPHTQVFYRGEIHDLEEKVVIGVIE